MFPLVTFITKDDDKAYQIRNILGTSFNFQVLHHDLHDYQGPERESLTEKCKEAAANYVGYPVATDITSLCFNALGGLPGTLTPSFLEKMNSTELYKLLQGYEDKSAYVLYTIGLLENEEATIKVFQGFVSGDIVRPKRKSASGWEACFKPDGYSVPYADLPQNVKAEISERGKALRTLKTYLIAEEFLSY